MSTIYIKVLNPDQDGAFDLADFEVWGHVKSISLQHDVQTVCSAVTEQNTIYVQRVESNEDYSF